jgi:hypothetical protein
VVDLAAPVADPTVQPQAGQVEAERGARDREQRGMRARLGPDRVGDQEGDRARDGEQYLRGEVPDERALAAQTCMTEPAAQATELAFVARTRDACERLECYLPRRACPPGQLARCGRRVAGIEQAMEALAHDVVSGGGDVANPDDERDRSAERDRECDRVGQVDVE